MVVRKEKCNPEGCGGYLCMRVSPSNRMGKKAIIKSSDGKVEVNEDLISDADRIASNKCPFGALIMVNLPESLNKEPLHRYGKNGFSLYNLPIPVFGKVTGIIGKNGVGKTTALNILAGHIQPNLGIEEKRANLEELKEYFKGSEAQAFLERREKGEIKVAYKPQLIDKIPEKYSGTVRELLNSVDEKGLFEDVVKQLSLEKILDREIDKISGGELQRVAIAATFLKKANVYFFDEPSSYLDIKQRMIVAKFIRNMIKEDIAIMVVEHDLIILDYLADLVHIIYGTPKAFGIVSGIKSAKAGINAFLSGYLKEENMQIREHSIRFSKRAITHKENEINITEWKDFEYSLGSFSLYASKGGIKRGCVTGILGENGIGKTTFARILVGEIQTPFSLKNMNLAYKPQYLKPKEAIVSEYLKDAFERYKPYIINPLEIENLAYRNMDELSGGELQIVEIAKALSEEADIVLLDEPSAYLDVEQRLKLSKVMRDIMDLTGRSAIIIDHDLLFLDYISHELLIFSGEPSIRGEVEGPFTMEDGMNRFLKDIDVTFRREEESGRPRANKPGSVKDREQKEEGKLYYC